jgi:PAS domain S-box-containing protein
MAASEDYLRILCDHAPDALRLVDRSGSVLYANHCECGHTRDEIVGADLETHLPPGAVDEGLRRALDRACAGGESHEGDVRYVDARGDRWCLMRCVSAGEGMALVVCSDITRRKRAELELSNREEQLRRAQRLEAVGRFACQIAHDFNNVLTAVLLTAEDLSSDLYESAPRAYVEEILEAVYRGTRLTSQLLAFSQRRAGATRTADLARCVADMAEMLQRLVGFGITVAIDLDRTIGEVVIDRGQLEQVLMNLAINARDAMPDGGVLKLKSYPCGGQDEEDDTPYAALAVTDTGSGIEPSAMERLFEPFFTTKASAGTGLGLAIVRSIVEQAGGYVVVETESGRGTTFTVCLPRARDAKPLGVPPPAERTLRGLSGTVLLVEPDPLVRSSILRILERTGLRVLAHASPSEAARVARKTPCDLLICDLILRGMRGVTLARDVARRQPEIRGLFVSGGCEPTPEVAGYSYQVLDKPIDSATLLAAIQRMLVSGP